MKCCCDVKVNGESTSSQRLCNIHRCTPGSILRTHRPRQAPFRRGRTVRSSGSDKKWPLHRRHAQLPPDEHHQLQRIIAGVIHKSSQPTSKQHTSPSLARPITRPAPSLTVTAAAAPCWNNDLTAERGVRGGAGGGGWRLSAWIKGILMSML